MAALLLATPCLNAQNTEYRNEITAGYGYVTFTDIVHVTAGVFATIFTLGYAGFDNFKSIGSFNLEYYRTLNNDTFSVGGALSYFGGSADVIETKTKEKTGKSTYRGIALMPSTKVFWFRNPKVSMYSKLAAGGMLFDDYDENNKHTFQPSFAAQVSPVAIEVGGEQFRGYVELGMGMQGVIVGGLHYNF